MDRTNYSKVCTERRTVTALAPGQVPPIGAHLIVPWLGFTHHGIYVGGGNVVHYGALMYDIIRKPVEEVSLDTFAEGRAVYVVEHVEVCFDSEQAIRRARSRLGEKRYKLFTNNCEHFVEWCLHDVPRSFQAETALAYPRLVGERIERALLGLARRLFALAWRPTARVRIEARTDDRRD
jgi:lecithin:retinol acyltransferase